MRKSPPLRCSLHYFRIHPAYWRDRLLRAKAMGLNTIQVRLPAVGLTRNFLQMHNVLTRKQYVQVYGARDNPGAAPNPLAGPEISSLNMITIKAQIVTGFDTTRGQFTDLGLGTLPPTPPVIFLPETHFVQLHAIVPICCEGVGGDFVHKTILYLPNFTGGELRLHAAALNS